MIRVLEGDARTVLATLPVESVHCCVTSPPYFGLRDYGVAGQIGLEATPAEYIASMVGVFREVRRVLRKDGTLWLNIGDSYAGSSKGETNHTATNWSKSTLNGGHGLYSEDEKVTQQRRVGIQPPGLKPKDLIGIPWLLAFALREDGWYLRADVIWSKPNPMPESVTDRPTKAHEYLFLLTRSSRYYYDADAIREPNSEWSLTALESNWQRRTRNASSDRNDGNGNGNDSIGSSRASTVNPAGRNKRSVWEIATEPFPEAHFATYPTALVEPCIKAGSPKGGTVLDPFCGAGTTLLVADRLERDAVGIELNPAYAEMARRRLVADAPMFVEVA